MLPEQATPCPTALLCHIRYSRRTASRMVGDAAYPATAEAGCLSTRGALQAGCLQVVPVKFFEVRWQVIHSTDRKNMNLIPGVPLSRGVMYSTLLTTNVCKVDSLTCTIIPPNQRLNLPQLSNFNNFFIEFNQPGCRFLQQL